MDEFKPSSTDTYVKHYLHGGSEIGYFFNADQTGFGLTNLLFNLGKKAVPLIKQGVKSLAKKGIKKAVPIIKREGGKILKESANDIIDVLNKKQTKKEAWNTTKNRIKKRAIDIIESEIKTKKPRFEKDIFS